MAEGLVASGMNSPLLTTVPCTPSGQVIPSENDTDGPPPLQQLPAVVVSAAPLPVRVRSTQLTPAGVTSSAAEPLHKRVMCFDRSRQRNNESTRKDFHTQDACKNKNSVD